MANTDAIVGWKTITFGCHVMEPGSSVKFRTGDWRSQRPVIDNEKCIKCGICWIYCPDMAIIQNEEGFFEVNMEYCKGCGICAHECPKDAITIVPEEG